MFDKFWIAYPKKVAKSTAVAAWNKHKPDETLLQTILSAIDCQKQGKQWQRNGGQYIPYPATWLNQKRWEDDLNQQGENHANKSAYAGNAI